MKQMTLLYKLQNDAYLNWADTRGSEDLELLEGLTLECKIREQIEQQIDWALERIESFHLPQWKKREIKKWTRGLDYIPLSQLYERIKEEDNYQILKGIWDF